MTEPGFRLVADVSSDDPGAVGPVLQALIDGEISTTTDGFHIEATVRGQDARELNRTLLSALRRTERRTRLRSEWTAGGTTHRFFDYASKGSRPSTQPERKSRHIERPEPP